MDLHTAIDQFARYLHMRGRSHGTQRKYGYLLSYYGDWLAQQEISWLIADGLQIEAYLEAYSVLHSKSSTALMSTCLRSFYRWARRKRLVSINPAEELEPIRRPRCMPRPLPDQRVKELLAALDTLPDSHPDGARDRLIVRMYLFTGMRLAELAGLDREDIDLDARMIIIRHGKGGYQRSVPINDQLYGDLMDWELPDTGPVFNSSRGRFASEGISQMFRRVIQRRLGFPDVTAHVLRHTHATKLRRCGADLRQLQTQLGHELPETTAIYTRVFDSELHDLVNKLDW